MIQLVLKQTNSLVELDRVGEVIWIGHPERVTSYLTAMFDNGAAHCHLYLLYLVEQQQTEFLVETIKHHYLTECCSWLVYVLFFWHSK